MPHKDSSVLLIDVHFPKRSPLIKTISIPFQKSTDLFYYNAVWDLDTTFNNDIINPCNPHVFPKRDPERDG